MKFSLNCLFLKEASVRFISVDISDEIIVGINRIKYEDIKVSHVKSLILSGKGVSYSPDNLNLWKVDRNSVDKNDKIVLKIRKASHGKCSSTLKTGGGDHYVSQFFTSRTKLPVSNPFKDSNSILKWIQEYLLVTGRQPLTLVETFGARFTLCGRDDTIETL
ncbi:hypothetical protein RhiirA4_412365 [Rhizophagus irregularis]|uniref:Uncharacterized protein n=1 Tax=Rhizophagus irregularis TaxID=588596 RepID=A0A2I1HK56_9GLOM|nr:hypothetical protein RhiirA4_412365 [Rhizophagus irregularis]